MKRDPNKYPKGWNRERVQAIIARYDNQTEDEAVAEDEAAWENSRVTMIPVPSELAADVRAFIAARRGTPRKRQAGLAGVGAARRKTQRAGRKASRSVKKARR